MSRGCFPGGDGFGGGYRKDCGCWVQLKHCFRACGASCDCQPRDGLPHYCDEHGPASFLKALEDCKEKFGNATQFTGEPRRE